MCIVVIPSSPPPLSPQTALRRWYRGHLGFFSLVQGVVAALESADRALGAGDAAMASEELDLASTLLRGSAAAFQLTSDFPSEVYESVVRPSMSEPEAPSGFSGLWSADHAALVGVLGRLKKSLPTTPGIDAARERLADALRAVYAVHGRVCERFVGSDTASLLSASKGKETPAPEVVRQFGENRVRLVCPVAHGAHV